MEPLILIPSLILSLLLSAALRDQIGFGKIMCRMNKVKGGLVEELNQHEKSFRYETDSFVLVPGRRRSFLSSGI